jgi:DNA polymerase
MAYALGDGPVGLWVPGDPVPDEVTYALSEGMDFRAWNANFERVMWRQILTPVYGFPPVPLETWVDTAAEAAAMALPRGLDKAAQVLQVSHQKDQRGHRLMLQMAKPRKKGPPPAWWDLPEKMESLYRYCKQDVRTERAIAAVLRPLSDAEREVYLLDQQANDRGVLIDLDLVRGLSKLADEATARADVRLQEITDGEVEAVTNVQNIRGWLDRNGVPLDDLTKRTVSETLQLDLPEAAREVLEIRAETGKTSVKKLQAMLANACRDGRARGQLLYHGAGTGRWSGKGIQPQNFPRPTIPDVESLIPDVLEGNYDGLAERYPIMEVVTSLLRSCFRAAPGRRFLCADFSAIEGHVTAWLADQPGGMLSYEEMAYEIFHGRELDGQCLSLREAVEAVKVTPNERMVGKVAVLGCGFGMGPDKYQDTVKAWTGLEISDTLAERVVAKYREQNNDIVRLWKELQSAAIEAVRHPGTIVRAGRNGSIRYSVRGQFLWCALPSGRPLAYAMPTLVDRMTPWGTMQKVVEIRTVDSMTKKWVRRQLYGGLQTENVVQAIARDLMVASTQRVQDAGYDMVLTVHDEVLCEALNDNGSLDEFNALMSERPMWGSQIPLKVEGWEGMRYRK